MGYVSVSKHGEESLVGEWPSQLLELQNKSFLIALKTLTIFYSIHWFFLSFTSQMLLICHFLRHFSNWHGSHMHTSRCYFFNKVFFHPRAQKEKATAKKQNDAKEKEKMERSISFIPLFPALALWTGPKYFEEHLNHTEFLLFPAGFVSESRESALPSTLLLPFDGQES